MTDLDHSPPGSPPASPPPGKRARRVSPASELAAAAAPPAADFATPAAVNGEAVIVNKGGKKRSAKRKVRARPPVDEVLMMDVENLLGAEAVATAVEADLDWNVPEGVERDVIIEVRVAEVGSHGDALSVYKAKDGRPWVILTPFALPKELVRVKLDRASRLHSKSELLEVLEKNEELRLKPGEGVDCKYFGKCGGCQFQMVSYETQLEWKRETVRKAFANFSKLDPSLIPEIGPTMPSPKQAGYRTKITPHFSSLPAPIRNPILKAAGLPIPHRKTKAPKISDMTTSPPASPAAFSSSIDEDDEMAGVNGAGSPPLEVADVKKAVAVQGGRGDGNRFFESPNGAKDWEVKIGFDAKGWGGVLDIEECPLATPILNQQLKEERRRTIQNIALYPRDSTLLLRDSSDPRSFDPSSGVPADAHICITDHKATVHERVGDYHFTFPAGSFFQNNNSILPSLTSFVRSAIVSPPTPSPYGPPTHLVDTYCGSGLFAITLSPDFEVVTGVEIDDKSVMYAKQNAALNGVGDKCEFRHGKSEEIFGTVKTFDWMKTVVVIDPPRKGCDEPFLKQLIDFHPQTVVYISCNVHTQARDIGYLLTKDIDGGKHYVLESLRGADLFSQTAHVEGIAVLRLV